MKKGFFCALALLSISLVADELQVYKIQPTPSNDQSRVKITSGGVVKGDDPIYLQVESFPIGVNAQSDYFKENRFRENLRGSTILLIFNGQMRRVVTTSDNNPYIEQRSYFNKRFRKSMDPALKKEIGSGDFVVLAILINSYGESVKMSGSSDQKVLYMNQRQRSSPSAADKAKQRAVYYNQPRGSFAQGQPILLDFYLQNTRLSHSSDQVVLYIDGQPRAYLTEWAPYSIRGLPKGIHEIRLELINSSGKAYDLPFGDQKELIEVR